MSGRFPQPGKIFEEKYRVEKLLGSGGFARVYLAEQTDLGRYVAIKVLSPRVARAVNAEETDPKIESVALRFEREARVVSQLKSAQTITMYDYGRTESGLLYMVMEYVDGVGLDQLEVPIAPRRVVKILRQMLQSLHEAHANGLLHRDLKPANIMVYEHLGEKDQVKLLDFGIVKAVGQAANDDEKDLTASDSLIGTPRYMSPEQIRGQEIGPASDIYSLGLVAYELLMGEKAVTNSDSIEILGQHLSSESFEIPRHHAIHPKLRRLVNKMLSKDLETRYRQTKDVLEDLAELERVDGDLCVGGPPPTPSDDELVLGDADLEFARDLSGEQDSSGTPRWAVAMVVVALLAGVGVVAVPQFIGPTTTEEAEQIELSEADEPSPEAAQSGAAQPDSAKQAAKDEAQDKDEEKQERVITLIRTRPKGASVWLGGELVGMAPVQFASTDHTFPLSVRAKLGEGSVDKTLETPGGEIWLELPAPEEESAPEKPEQVKPRPKQEPKQARTSQARPKKASSEKAERAEEAPEQQPKEEVDTRKYLPLE